MVVANVLTSARPVIVFCAFVVGFAIQARRRGQSVNEYLWQRNRTTFRNLKPGWWKPHVVFAALGWTVVLVTVGFKLVLVAALPLVLLWVPLWGFVLRSYFRRH